MEPIQDDRCLTCGDTRVQFVTGYNCPDPFHGEPIQDDRPMKSIRKYECGRVMSTGERCPARGWRKWLIHNCAEELGWGW
jgi:hypothetical protein